MERKFKCTTKNYFACVSEMYCPNKNDHSGVLAIDQASYSMSDTDDEFSINISKKPIRNNLSVPIGEQN